MSARHDGWSVGLDIGGTKVLGVLLDADGRVADTVRHPTLPGLGGVLGSAARTVEQLCAQARLAPAGLRGVGIGVPGVVDPGRGTVSHAVNLRIAEQDAPLGASLSARLGGVPVTVENDLNVAALGAAAVLGIDGDLAFLALGTGVAAGILLDGRLRRGASGAAGEIGHVPYLPDGPRCACGQRGCLELYASGGAIDASWPSRTGRPAPVEVFEAAAAGDRQAVAVRDRFTTAVASAIRILVLTCDVEHVVLGGGVAALGEPLRDAVAAALDDLAEGSPFLASLHLAARVQVVPTDVPVAPIGAALSVAPPTEEVT